MFILKLLIYILSIRLEFKVYIFLLQIVAALALALILANCPPQNPYAAPPARSALSAALVAPGIITQSNPFVFLFASEPYPQHCEVMNPFPKYEKLRQLLAAKLRIFFKFLFEIVYE